MAMTSFDDILVVLNLSCGFLSVVWLFFFGFFSTTTYKNDILNSVSAVANTEFGNILFRRSELFKENKNM